MSINKYAKNVYSQNGEDGIIAECIKRIGFDESLTAVEFGGHDGKFCSNTYLLQEQKKAVVYMYDIAPGSPIVEQKTITPHNVNELPECSILSIDIDGNDYNVWAAYNGQPDIVIIEINSSVDPDAMAPVSDLNHGTGYLPMKLLGQSKGYFLLCHTGNLIFVLNKHIGLFPDRDETFKRDWL